MLTVQEIANKLSVTDRTVRLWLESGRLKGYKFGKDYRVDPEDFKEFVENARVNPDAIQNN